MEYNKTKFHHSITPLFQIFVITKINNKCSLEKIELIFLRLKAVNEDYSNENAEWMYAWMVECMSKLVNKFVIRNLVLVLLYTLYHYTFSLVGTAGFSRIAGFRLRKNPRPPELCRNGGIWTRDHLNPIQVRYRAAPRSVFHSINVQKKVLTIAINDWFKKLK